ncbi:Beta-ketoacyl synthase, active site-containing protein [Cynara cardunculus var. scolymus]|uniref:beta-ketoacyl-[acyl-carrier-protein] synthase I n=1 Tax=Cynara cardunculus var. scolymus TaxID=59895 RepID=A0A124SGB1_CYNCS|nr:Beta-ketoacyl synthase, active site-containing protein [Cynara cardunculus var. scolymus]
MVASTAVASPFCTWLVAACMSVSGDKNDYRPKPSPSPALFSSSKRLSRSARRKLSAVTECNNFSGGGGLMSSLCGSGIMNLMNSLEPSIAVQPAKDATTKKKPVTKKRRVVVTGLGVVSPVGHVADVFYENLVEGVSGISEIEAFDCDQFPTKIAGEIKSFSADGWVAPKLSKRADKFMLYLLTAGKKALEDGGVTEDGWMGPNYSISTACATSNFCILNAANHIIRGESDMMLSGGSDSAIIPIGTGIALCIEKALAQSGVAREDVNYINAHATSTQSGDLNEYEAIIRCFGDNSELKINSTKSMIGHLLGAAGAVEAIATVKAIQTGWLHPNINLENPDVGVDKEVLVGAKKEQCNIKVALSNSFGFGGHNSSILFAPYKDQ